MPNTFLSQIEYPKDLRKLTTDQLPDLAKELRDFVINIVATKEGHLGASLGVIELTIALHYIFDTPNDLLVWDVGHQGVNTIFLVLDILPLQFLLLWAWPLPQRSKETS